MHFDFFLLDEKERGGGGPAFVKYVLVNILYY
jgi:hypothetical protein